MNSKKRVQIQLEGCRPLKLMFQKVFERKWWPKGLWRIRAALSANIGRGRCTTGIINHERLFWGCTLWKSKKFTITLKNISWIQIFLHWKRFAISHNFCISLWKKINEFSILWCGMVLWFCSKIQRQFQSFLATSTPLFNFYFGR